MATFYPQALSNFGRAVPITTSDSVVQHYAAIYVGVTGDVSAILEGDSTNAGVGTPVLFKAVPVGILPIAVKQVMAAGTTATNMVGFT